MELDNDNPRERALTAFKRMQKAYETMCAAEGRKPDEELLNIQEPVRFKLIESEEEFDGWFDVYNEQAEMFMERTQSILDFGPEKVAEMESQVSSQPWFIENMEDLLKILEPEMHHTREAIKRFLMGRTALKT